MLDQTFEELLESEAMPWELTLIEELDAGFVDNILNSADPERTALPGYSSPVLSDSPASESPLRAIIDSYLPQRASQVGPPSLSAGLTCIPHSPLNSADKEVLQLFGNEFQAVGSSQRDLGLAPGLDQPFVPTEALRQGFNSTHNTYDMQQHVVPTARMIDDPSIWFPVNIASSHPLYFAQPNLVPMAPMVDVSSTFCPQILRSALGAYPAQHQALAQSSQNAQPTQPGMISNSFPHFQPIAPKRRREDEDVDGNVEWKIDIQRSPRIKRPRTVTASGRQRFMNPKTTGANSRSRNIDEFNPHDYYRSLRPEDIPLPWVAKGSHPLQSTRFEYDEYGQLRQMVFTSEQIRSFLYENPGNWTSPSVRDPRRGTFTLWVQCCPADGKIRYMPERGGTDKCRFAECPVKNKTIMKGQYRVAFDEFAFKRPDLDPYNVAGFAHLYCMERFLDFPRICKDLRVLPDDRRLLEPKNSMSICRDHKQNKSLVLDFIRTSTPFQPGAWDYSKTLCSILTEMHLTLEPKKQAEIRLQQGGNNLSIHRNDLELLVSGANQLWMRKKRQKEAWQERGEIHMAGDKDVIELD